MPKALDFGERAQPTSTAGLLEGTNKANGIVPGYKGFKPRTDFNIRTLE